MDKSKAATPPPLPLEELQDICNRATEGKVWAVGEGKNSKGNAEWYVFSTSKKLLKRLPQTYRGRKVVTFVSPRPRILKSE